MKGPNDKIWLGKHWGTPINEIPLDYLFWLFPKLKRNKKDVYLFHGILEHFLSMPITMVDRNKEAQGYCFYLDEFKKYLPGTHEEIPFLKSSWRNKDSNGEFVYEIDHVDSKFYIHQVNQKWAFNYNIVYHNYIYGGYPMVYEKNPGYQFYDGYGKIINGAYLLRKPWIPDGSIADNFSENIKI